jgi:hypothetical protein
MFGHTCPESISLICAHPYSQQIAICTMHQNLTLFDAVKNRSVRQFSIPEKRLSAWVGHAQPIGLFFVDNVASRCLQCVLKSTILLFPTSVYIALVFPRGAVTWNHTITEAEWHPFEFAAGAVVQTPDSLVLADAASGALYAVSLLNWQSRKFAAAAAPAAYLFASQFTAGEFGIVAVSSGLIELFAASGRLACQSPTESCKSACFDVFSSTLFFMRRPVVRSYSVTPAKIERISECMFIGVTVHGAKATNYTLQAICPCRLPMSVQPLFFALCDGPALLIGASSKVVQKVLSYPSPEFTKKINPSIVLPHPTDTSLIMIGSGTDLLVLDIAAHLPQIVPSLGIPPFLRQTQVFEGVFNVFQTRELILVVNRSKGEYKVYNPASKAVIASRAAIDVVLGPGGLHADLRPAQPPSRKSEVLLHTGMIVQVYNFDQPIATVPVKEATEFAFPLRLVSLGEFFAVILGVRALDLAFNPQRQPHTRAILYAWRPAEPVSLHFDGASLLAFDRPHLAVASPNAYAIFDIEHAMRRRVERSKRVLHMKFFEKKLYVLTPEGLEIDDLRRVALISGRFSHLLTIEKNAPLVPVNAVMIEGIQDRAVTLVDTRGNISTIGIPEEGRDADRPILMDIAQAPNAVVAASEAYDAGASREDVKRILLMLLNEMGWDAVEPFLSESERAVSELTMNEDDRELQEEFNAFAVKELEVEPM